MIFIKWFTFTLVAVLIVGGLLVGANWAPTNEPQTETQPVQSFMVAKDSPTPAPLPTLDYVATQVVLLDRLEAQLRENDQLRQEVADLKAQVVQQGADATAQAWQSQENIARANAAQADAEARDNEAKAQLKAADNETKALAIKDKQTEAELISAQAQARNGWLVLAGAVAFGGGMAIGGRALAKAPRKGEPAQSESPILPSAQIVQIQSAQNESVEVCELHLNITHIERAILRRAVIELNGVLSRRRLTGYYSEQRAEQILVELRRENANGVALAVIGPNSVTLATPQLYQWLGLPTPPPLVKSPETGENTAESHPTPPHSGGADHENAEGEGDTQTLDKSEEL